jgi:hypothetical protein
VSADRIQEVLDRIEIEDVLHRYCRGIDRCDEKILRSVYHEGAVDDHGVFKGDASDFAAFILPILEGNYEATQHHLTNIRIELNGDSARAETYYVAFHRSDSQHALEQSGGRYLDRFERRDGRWAIVDRLVVMDWIQTESLGPDHPMAAAFTYGARREEDPSYEADRVVS